jgi:hypothetical protein
MAVIDQARLNNQHVICRRGTVRLAILLYTCLAFRKRFVRLLGAHVAPSPTSIAAARVALVALGGIPCVQPDTRRMRPAPAAVHGICAERKIIRLAAYALVVQEHCPADMLNAD